MNPPQTHIQAQNEASNIKFKSNSWISQIHRVQQTGLPRRDSVLNGLCEMVQWRGGAWGFSGLTTAQLWWFCVTTDSPWPGWSNSPSASAAAALASGCGPCVVLLPETGCHAYRRSGFTNGLKPATWSSRNTDVWIIPCIWGLNGWNCLCKKEAGIPVDSRMNVTQQCVFAARWAIVYWGVLTREETAGSLYLLITRANLEYCIQILVHSRKHT